MRFKPFLLIAALHAASLAGNAARAEPAIKHVIVIAMENTDADQIYGRSRKAPFINTELMPKFARAAKFRDPLVVPKNLPSESHYLWMEAGTNAFADHAFTSNGPPTARHSTASTDHLVAQIRATSGRSAVTWMTYQQGLSAKTGDCPIEEDRGTHYAPKHNPFVFFQDIAGNPPSKDSRYCAQHTRSFAEFSGDLKANRLADYVFITPDLCNDMHADIRNACIGHRIRRGDDWLKANLPPMIDWANQNSGVIFLVWDEGEGTFLVPFLAIGKGVKANYKGKVAYDHGSLVKSIEMIFGLPILPAVKDKNDFGDLFVEGAFP